MSGTSKDSHGRYLVFGGQDFTAKGGMRDLVASFADRDAALQEASSSLMACKCHWTQVYDRVDGEIVFEDSI